MNLPPSPLTEESVAAWLFKSRYEHDAEPPPVFYANDLRQARAVLALVDAERAALTARVETLERERLELREWLRRMRDVATGATLASRQFFDKVDAILAAAKGE